jgi:hypothetical protein
LRHDDRLDALALAVKFWTDYLDRDVTREEDKRIEELFEAELRRFEEAVFGFSRRRDNYFDNY